MINLNLIDYNIPKAISTRYFAHHKTIGECKYYGWNDPFLDNYEDLSKDDWELHKQSVREWINKSHITKAIPSDDIEKLQEISSQNILILVKDYTFSLWKIFLF